MTTFCSTFLKCLCCLTPDGFNQNLGALEKLVCPYADLSFCAYFVSPFRGLHEIYYFLCHFADDSVVLISPLPFLQCLVFAVSGSNISLQCSSVCVFSSDLDLSTSCRRCSYSVRFVPGFEGINSLANHSRLLNKAACGSKRIN